MNKNKVFLIAIVFLILATLFWFFYGVRDNGGIDHVTNLPITSSSSEVARQTGITVSSKDGGQEQFSIKPQDVVKLSDNFFNILEVEQDTSSDFDIMYSEVANKILITLYKEPLGEVRKEAEQVLLTKLSDDKTLLCSLDIVVFTNEYVNRYYAGYDNLGLSFCPGAVEL